MVVNEKQLNNLIASTELDYINTYLHDLEYLRKMIIGLDLKIDKMIEENLEVTDPFDYAMNNNIIKELEKTKNSFIEMKELLITQFSKLSEHLKQDKIDDNIKIQLDALANEEYYVELSNEHALNESYSVNHNELLNKNEKTKNKMLGEDYKNIKRR
jgi:hypothetical protein